MNASTQVIRAIETMTQAFHNQELARVLGSYESEASVAFVPGQPKTRVEDLEAGFREFFQLKPRFEYAGHEVMVQGDLAVHLAPWTMRGTAPDGSVIEQRGLSVAVLRRQADGQWLLVIDNPHGQALWEAANGVKR